MKVQLNIPERLILIGLLPEKGSFDTMKMIDSLRDSLYPSEEEVKEFEIVQTEETIKWNLKAVQPKEIEFTEKQVEFFKESFNEVSEKKELTLQQFAVSKKF